MDITKNNYFKILYYENVYEAEKSAQLLILVYEDADKQKAGEKKVCKIRTAPRQFIKIEAEQIDTARVLYWDMYKGYRILPPKYTTKDGIIRMDIEENCHMMQQAGYPIGNEGEAEQKELEMTLAMLNQKFIHTYAKGGFLLEDSKFQCDWSTKEYDVCYGWQQFYIGDYEIIGLKIEAHWMTEELKPIVESSIEGGKWGKKELSAFVNALDTCDTRVKILRRNHKGVYEDYSIRIKEKRGEVDSKAGMKETEKKLIYDFFESNESMQLKRNAGIEELYVENIETWSKMSRQLKEYHIFRYVECVDYSLLRYWFSVNIRTIQRDIKDLTDAGLISVTYSNNPYKKGYVSTGKEPVFYEEPNRNRRRHLRRLNRIGTLMRELYDPYEGIAGEKEECKQVTDTVKAQYQALFPEVGERTMRRDFELLSEIEYFVYYDAECFGHRVNFPDMY